MRCRKHVKDRDVFCQIRNAYSQETRSLKNCEVPFQWREWQTDQEQRKDLRESNLHHNRLRTRGYAIRRCRELPRRW